MKRKSNVQLNKYKTKAKPISKHLYIKIAQLLFMEK